MIILPELPTNPNQYKIMIRNLAKINGYEFTQLLTPCHQPKVIKYWVEIKNTLNIDENDIKLFYKGFKSQYLTQFKVISNNITSALVIGIIFYSRIKQHEIVKLLYFMLAMRFYSNLVHRNFKYCKPEIWETALQQLSQKHLFKIHNSIPNTLAYLCRVEIERNFKLLSSKEMTEKELIVIVYALRHRIAQSIRSFTVKYYELEQNKDSGTTTATGEEEVSSILLLSEKISSSICTYNQIDKVALIKALQMSKILKDAGISIVENLSDNSHKEKVRFLLILMNRVVPIKEWCLDSRRLTLARKILTDKEKISNKYSIKKEILNLFDELDVSIPSIKSVNKNVTVLFIIHYLAFYVRNRNCG